MDERLDIHQFEKRLAAIQQKIQSDPKVRPANKTHIAKFVDYCFATDMQKSSIAKDLYSLWFFAHHLRKDFSKANKDDFNGLARMVREQEWSDWTKRNHRVAIRKFMKWLKGGNKFYPIEIEDITTGGKLLKSFLPEDILANDEVRRMFDAADNIRDKTLVMSLALLGARIGEVLNMKIKHVRFQPTGEVICMLMGKTGYRTVVSIPLAPQLANYIENGHPTKNPDDFLWLTKHNMFAGREIIGKRYSKRLGKEVEFGRTRLMPLTYRGAMKVLHKLADRAGIKKHISPHWFRRYAATQDASYMSDRLMMLKYGWSTPEVVGVYTRLSSQSLIDAERKRHGRAVDDGKPELTVVTCPRCRLDNPPGGKFCGKCGMVLSAAVATKLRQVEDARSQMMLNPKNEKLFEDFMVWLKRKRKVD